MDYIITNHARVQMQLREITESIIGVEFLSFEILNRKVETTDSIAPIILTAIAEAQKEVKARLLN
jgi:hypothetical protein